MIRLHISVHLETSTGEKLMCLVIFIILWGRERHEIFQELSMLESEQISDLTGCLKPCHYKKYILLGEQIFKSPNYQFDLWAVSSNTRVETEELKYPLSTLVAEFGGTLGLFLGLSFISVWDNFEILKKIMASLGPKSWAIMGPESKHCWVLWITDSLCKLMFWRLYWGDSKDAYSKLVDHVKERVISVTA